MRNIHFLMFLLFFLPSFPAIGSVPVYMDLYADQNCSGAVNTTVVMTTSNSSRCKSRNEI